MTSPIDIPWHPNELRKLAKAQKQVLAMFFLNLVFLFWIAQYPALALAVGFIQVYFLYTLAKNARSSVPWLYAVLAFVPLVNLLALLHVNDKATRALKSNGVRVGLFGAKA